MKKYVEIEPICPLIGKQCIKDGWQHWNQETLRPCMFWDAEKSYNGIKPQEACRLKKAINKILADEDQYENDSKPVDVPY